MARCYYLEYKSRGFLSSSNDKYYCKLCGREFDPNSTQVKYTCNSDYGENYKDCPVYKDRKY